MRILILGGTGWVGHHVAIHFHRADYQVTVASRGKKQEFISELPRDIALLSLDKTRESEMAAVFKTAYDIVVDTVPTEATIDLIVKYAPRLKQYIHCSSTGGYAPLPFIPGDETMPYSGSFGAGWKQKCVVDTKVMQLFQEQGFPATVIRPCYISGPGMLPLDNQGGRRNDFIKDIVNNITLDLPDDGLALLQPIHVADLGWSFLLAAETSRSIGQIYNICLKKAVTLTRYLEITAAAFGRKAAINYLPLEAMLKKYQGKIDETGLRFMAAHMCFDIGKARTQLGFQPRHTTEATIEETARWAAIKTGCII
ncbi:MAG: NAD-dependent epimerase/dehydratase family protein [Verrucomicrobia bacterium]|nr:NAD-dependent epimerase/dehydratase family protein [Verrucomicrobiota bacterium]MBU1736360.1 NAD-dependent epimerase/dehydratase family protein [Verrucomicrobiota bacterium]MBU1858147.1 NAD-dependent epimerase/dehydratase family protein [Verrucomicrobiota bacterium]